MLHYCSYLLSFVRFLFSSESFLPRSHQVAGLGVLVQYGRPQCGFSWCSAPLSHGWNSSPEYLFEETGEERDHDYNVRLMDLMKNSKETSKLLY